MSTADDEKKLVLPFKEKAASFTAFITVIAFISIGFLIMGSAILGKTVTAPGDWLAAMLSLASAALGFLIGKQADPGYSPSAPAVVATQAFDPALVTDPTVCSCCGQKLPPIMPEATYST